MNMRHALTPADCDKMTHFLQYIARLHSNSNSRCRVDVTAAIRNYRNLYGNKTISDRHREHLQYLWDKSRGGMKQ